MKQTWTAADASYYCVLCNTVLDCDSSVLSVQEPSVLLALHAFHTWHNGDVTCGLCNYVMLIGYHDIAKLLLTQAHFHILAHEACSGYNTCNNT